MMTLVFGLLTASLFLALTRLARGPTLLDRVVAMDLMATLILGLSAAYAVATKQSLILDVAVVLALFAFLCTVSFAHFIEKGKHPWHKT